MNARGQDPIFVVHVALDPLEPGSRLDPSAFRAGMALDAAVVVSRRTLVRRLTDTLFPAQR